MWPSEEIQSLPRWMQALGSSLHRLRLFVGIGRPELGLQKAAAMPVAGKVSAFMAFFA